MKLIKLIEESTKSSEDTCKGQIYRYRCKVWIGKDGEIFVRKSMRRLKKKSCQGCEKCGWMDESLINEIEDDSSVDIFEGLQDGGLYALGGDWTPGPFEYPHDGDMEMIFKLIPED